MKKILLVEDQEDQFLLIEAAFEAAGLDLQLDRVDGGIPCLAYLRKEGPYADASTPDLILLDLNMPRIGGFEVLEQMAKDDRLKWLPVVVLTTSNNPADVRKAYALGCRSYVAKPLDFNQLAKVLGQLVGYWFGLVSLPTPSKGGPIP